MKSASLVVWGSVVVIAVIVQSAYSPERTAMAQTASASASQSAEAPPKEVCARCFWTGLRCVEAAKAKLEVCSSKCTSTDDKKKQDCISKCEKAYESTGILCKKTFTKCWETSKCSVKLCTACRDVFRQCSTDAMVKWQECSADCDIIYRKMGENARCKLGCHSTKEREDATCVVEARGCADEWKCPHRFVLQ